MVCLSPYGLSVWLDRRHIQNKYGAAYTHFFIRWKKKVQFHGRKIKINNNSEHLLILKVCAGHWTQHLTALSYLISMQPLWNVASSDTGEKKLRGQVAHNHGWWMGKPGLNCLYQSLKPASTLFCLTVKMLSWNALKCSIVTGTPLKLLIF